MEILNHDFRRSQTTTYFAPIHPYVQEAIAMISKVRPAVTHYKVGLELYSATVAIYFIISTMKSWIFSSILSFMTFPHCCPSGTSHYASSAYFNDGTLWGSLKMLRAAADAKNEHEHGTHTKLVAAIALPHHTDQEMPGLGVERSVSDQAKRLAELAQKSGVDGVVCSAHEAETLQDLCGEDFVLQVPASELKAQGLTINRVS